MSCLNILRLSSRRFVGPLVALGRNSPRTVSALSNRHFQTSGPLCKAIDNWKRPSMEEYGVPKERWSESNDRTQKKNNLILLGGALLFGCTVLFAKITDAIFFNTTPKLVYTMNYVSKYPSSETSTPTISLVSSKSSEETATKNVDPTPQASNQESSNSAKPPITSFDKKATPDVPDHVPYLLVGAGTASFAAYRAIRAKDAKAKILIVGEETRLPYMRPPLSKELWFSELAEPQFEGDIRFKQWNGRTRSIFYEPNAFYLPYKELASQDKGGVSILSGRKVVKIDATKQEAHLDNGQVIKYDRCLLATGGKPKVVSALDSNSLVRGKTSTFRTVESFFDLSERAQRIESIAVIGGGFLGSELACALGHYYTKNNKPKVYQIFPEDGNMGKVLPDYLSQWTTEKVKNEGVNVMPNTRVKFAKVNDFGKLILSLSNGEELEVDHAVVAVGIEPNIDLAKDSKLEIDRDNKGYRVNAELEARTNLWVAGDAASFYDEILGRRRVEHHDHAVVSGRLAGENMASHPTERKPYSHQSMFWSDLGPDVGYEAIGVIDSSLNTIGVFAKATESDTPRAIVMKADETVRSDMKKEEQQQESPSEKGDETATSKGVEKKEEDEKYGKGVIFYLRDDVVVGIVLWNVFGRMDTARKVIRENRKYEDLADLAKLFNLHDKKEDKKES